MKITYPLVPYPHTYIARFAPFTKDEGMCHKTKVIAKREQRDKHNTNTPQGLKHQPRPRRSIVGPSGQVSSQEGQNKHPWMDEVKAPTKTERPPSIPQKQGVSSNRKRGRQKQSHLSLTLDASGAGCRDYKSGMRQSPGSARRERDVNTASRHSTRPKQEGSNIRPGEGEGKESTRTERPPSVPQ